MLQIKERSTEQLTILDHGPRVFHDALALVKQGETRFHVKNPVGDDYDLAYIHNMELFTDQIKTFILAMTCSQDLHPDFLDYDENDRENLCLEFLSQFDRAEFGCVDEYTVTVARIILKFTNMPVVFNDRKILWFIDEEARLAVTDHFEEAVPKGTLRVTPNPVELGKTKMDWSLISSVIAFQNLFFWQVLRAGKPGPLRYVEVVLTHLTGIGAILAHVTALSKALEKKGLTAYLSPGCTRYPDRLLSHYFHIRTKPDDASEDNTVLMDKFVNYSITWYFSQYHPDFDETILDETFAAQINEYADAVLGGKRVLGILARGTDYRIMDMGGDKVHATVPQMLPRIREWMKEGNYEKIFLATEDQDILDEMRKAFPNQLIAIAQERHSISDFKKEDSNLIYELEHKLRTGQEYDAALEDTTVNYFYALYILSKCQAFLCSGMCNGWDVVRSFNHGRFEREYKFTVGLTGDPATENWKALRPLFAGIFARSVYPENKAFYMTFGFCLDQPVSPEAIKEAWDKTMQIYPYYTKAVVKRNRIYYLTENPLDFVISGTDEIIEPATAAGNYHSVTICYKDKRLYFYVDHVITDGTGLRMVLDTFFYYYFCALDGTSYPLPQGVRSLEDGPAADQETDAYLMVQAIDPQQFAAKAFGKKEVFLYPELQPDKTGYTLEECGHYVIQVPAEEFIGYAKKVGGSPSSLLFQLTFQTLQRRNPDNKLPFRAFLPVSVRKAMGNPDSLLHQVVHTTYECDPDLLEDDSRAPDLNQGFRAHLKDFSSRDNITMMCGVYRGIIDAYKQAIQANMLDKIRENNSSVSISAGASFIGRLAAADYGSRIHMECIRVMPGHDFHTYMLEAGQDFYISMTLGTKTDRYVRDMADHMRSLGMTHTCWREV